MSARQRLNHAALQSVCNWHVIGVQSARNLCAIDVQSTCNPFVHVRLNSGENVWAHLKVTRSVDVQVEVTVAQVSETAYLRDR